MSIFAVLHTTLCFFAAKTRQQEYDEAMATAREHEIRGYVLMGIAFAIVIIGAPIAAYFENKRKKRKKAEKETAAQKANEPGNAAP